MQSLLQYRATRIAVLKLFERDEEKRLHSAKSRSFAAPFPLQAFPHDTLSSNRNTAKSSTSSIQPNENFENTPREQGIPSAPQTQDPPSEPESLDHSGRHNFENGLRGTESHYHTTQEGRDELVFIVGWNGPHDTMNPRNFSTASRIGMTLIVATIGFVVGVASSIDAAVSPQAAAEFGVSDVVESLVIGVYLMGFAAGAFFAGPFSETFGRNVVYIISMLAFMIFVMASGLAPNIGAQLSFRFLAGFFGSTPLTCAGGSVSDMWDPLEKTFAFPLFAISAFGGPVIGPVMGSYVTAGRLDTWRWSEWITLISAGLVLTLILLFQKETYSPLLLKWKAEQLRKVTGDDRFRAAMEITKTTIWHRLYISLKRPFLMATEPIVILFGLYLTVLYIILFTFLDGYTYVFGDVYGTSQGLTNVLFLGIFGGILLAAPLVPLIYFWTRQEFERNVSKGDASINPEGRLWFAMLGGAPAIPIALLWMGWTDFAAISIWSPILASSLFGFGLICVFMSAYMYIIDSYEMYAASALAFVTFARYLVAGAMTVVGVPFYKNLGTHWTLTILAVISVLLVPVPYVLYKHGYVIRRLSKYVPHNKD